LETIQLNIMVILEYRFVTEERPGGEIGTFDIRALPRDEYNVRIGLSRILNFMSSSFDIAVYTRLDVYKIASTDAAPRHDGSPET
jgi:hypothetical protein